MAGRDVTKHADTDSGYDRRAELKALDDTKAGVKGLADSGITKVPRIFLQSNNIQSPCPSGQVEPKFSVPVIDLEGVMNDDARRRVETVGRVRRACEKWGFFQVVNHGINGDVLDEIIAGIRRFHEQEPEAKRALYSRDYATRKVLYNTNFDLYTGKATNWRDTLSFVVTPNSTHELPEICRYMIL